MEKLLTIIVPTYNMEKYLTHGLDSFLIKNNFDLLEVLVVIDGGVDRSSEIAHCYQKRYPDVFKVIDKENGNYGSCINRGLKEATGKYVKVLDADDTFNINAFEQFIKYLKNVDADLILNQLDHVDEEGKLLKETQGFHLKDNTMLTFDDLEKKDWLLSMACTTYKTSMLKKINYKQTEGISYTDEQWTFTPINAVKTVFYIKQPVYRYLIGREGQTVARETRLNRVGQVIQLLYDMIEAYSELNVSSKRIQEYLDFRLYSLIEYVYSAFLLIKRDMDQNPLIEFDTFLKDKNNNLFKLTNGCVLSPKIKFKYIKYWRTHSRKVVPSYLLLLNSIINKLHR